MYPWFHSTADLSLRFRSCVASGFRAGGSLLSALLLQALLIGIVVPPVYAGPQGANVQHGDVNVERPDDTTTRVNQDSQDAIINWERFDVGVNESVEFDQPGASARALNRVVQHNPSEIRGSLTADGQIYLVNPAGILFGPSSTVNAAKLYAAAGGMSNEDFLAGKDLFADLEGTVENFGDLNGTGVHLFGQQVANFGTIDVADGVITMSSGEDVLLGTRDGHVFAKVTDAEQPTGDDGAAVKNEGTVDAGDGSVRMSAGDMFATSIFNDGGTVKADDIELDGGNGKTLASGTIDASTDEPGGQGGSIKILGENVGLFDGAEIMADGPAGGGRINVGGSKKGGGPLPNAENTFVGSNVTISADATVNGDGGQIIVWSDGTTRSSGRMTSTGGPEGGDGGFVEVSGTRLDTSISHVDVSAPEGKDGRALFDPETITIDAATGDGDDDDADGNEFSDITSGGENELTFSDGPSSFLIGEDEIENDAGNTTGTIALRASRTINVSGDFSDDDGTVADAGDLLVPSGLDLILKTDNDGVAGGIDLTTSADAAGLAVQTQGTGTITIVGSSSGNSTGNVTLPVLRTAGAPVSVTTRTGRVSIQGGIDAGTGDVTLDATAGIDQQPTAPIIAGGVELLGAGPVTLTSNGNDIGSLAGRITGVGNTVSVTDTGSLSIGTVQGTSGLTTSDGDVMINTGGDLTLGDDTVGEELDTGAGNVVLDSDGDIDGSSDNGAPELIGNNVDLDADSNGIGGTTDVALSANLLDADTTAGDGAAISIDATGNVTVGLVRTGQGTGQDVTVNASGNIRQDGDAAEDVVGDTVTLTADTGGIGTQPSPVDVNVETAFNADTTADAGGVFVDSPNADLLVDTVDARGPGTSGDVVLRSSNTVEASADDGDVEVDATNLGIVAGDGIGNETPFFPNQSDQVLETTVDTLNASESSGAYIEIDNKGDLELTNAVLGINASSAVSDTGGGNTILTAGSDLTISSPVDVTGHFYTSVTDDIIVNAHVTADGNVGLRADADGSADAGNGSIVHNSGQIRADDDTSGDGGVLLAGHNIQLDAAGFSPDVIAEGTFGSETPPDSDFGVAVLAQDDLRVNSQITSRGSTDGHVILQADADLSDADAGGVIDVTSWPEPLNDDPSTAAADDGYGEAADQTGGLTFNTSGSAEAARVEASGAISMVSGDDIRVVESGMTFQSGNALDRTGNNDDLHRSAGFAAIAAGSVDLAPNSGNVTINVNDPAVFEAGRDFSGFSSVDREDFAVTNSPTDPGATLNLSDVNLSGGALEVQQSPSVTLGGTYSVPWVHVESTAGSISVNADTVFETEERDTFDGSFHDTPYGILLDAAANVTINDTGTTFDTDRDDGMTGTLHDIGIGAGGTVTISGSLGTDSLTSNPPQQVLNADNIVIGDDTITGDRLDHEPDAVFLTSTSTLRANSINIDSQGSAGVTLGGTIEATDASGSLDIDTSTSGAITQTGGKIDVSGTTDLAAGSSNNISLSENDNDFNDDNSGSSTVSVTSAKNVTLSDEDSLPLGAITTTGGDLDVDTSGEVEVILAVDVDGAANVNTAGNGGPGGPINDDGGSGSLVVEERTTLAAGTTTSTFDISLVNGSTNDFDEDGSSDELIITRAANVTIDDIDDLTLGDADVRGNLNLDTGAATTLLGTVTVQGDADVNTTENGAGGAITQPVGSMTVDGATNLVAGSGNDISLTQTDNDFDASDSGSALTVGPANNVSIDDEDDLTLGISDVNGNLDLNTAGFVDVTGGEVNVAGDASVDTDKNGGTGGEITDDGGYFVVNGAATLDAVNEDVALDTGSAPFHDFSTLSITVADDAEVQEANAVTLDTIRVDGGGGGNGNLILAAANSGAGAIDDVTGSAIRVAGNADLSNDATTMPAPGDITLGNDSTDTVNVGTLTLNSGGTATLTEDSGTAFTGDSDVNALDLTSFGAITDTPAAQLDVANNATIDNTVVTDDILLGDQPGDTVNFGTLTFTSQGNVIITENSDMDIVGGPNTGVNVRLKVLSSINIGGAGVDANGDIIASATENVIADADVLADRDIIVRADDDASASPTRGDFIHQDGIIEADTNNGSSGGILIAAHNIELDPAGGTTADNLETSGIVANTDNPPRGIGDDPTAIGLLASNDITIREDVEASTGGGPSSHIVINADADLSNVDNAWPAPIAGTADGPVPDSLGTVTVASGVGGTDTASSALDLVAAGAVQFAGVNVDFVNSGQDINVEANATVDRSDSGDDYHGPASLTVFAEEDITGGALTTLESDAGKLLVKADYEFTPVSNRPELGIPAGDGNPSGTVSLNGTLDSDDGVEVFAGSGASNVSNAFADWVHVDVAGSLSVNSGSDIEGEFTDTNGAVDNHVPATIELDAGQALTINDGVDLDADRDNDGVGIGEGLIALGSGTTMTIEGGVGTDSGGSENQAREILLGDTGNGRLNTPGEIVMGASFSDVITATQDVTAETNSTAGFGISINDYRIESQDGSVDLEADANGTAAGAFELTGDSRIVADADDSTTGQSVSIHGQSVVLNAQTTTVPASNPELEAGDSIDVDSDTFLTIGTGGTVETDLGTTSGDIDLTAVSGPVTQNDGSIIAADDVDIDATGGAFDQNASAGNSAFDTDAVRGTGITIDSDTEISVASDSSDDALMSTDTAGIVLTASAGADVDHLGDGDLEAADGGRITIDADAAAGSTVLFNTDADVETTGGGQDDVVIDATAAVDQADSAHRIMAEGDVRVGQNTPSTTVDTSGLVQADTNDGGADDVLMDATGNITQNDGTIRAGSAVKAGTGGVRITSTGGTVTLVDVQANGSNQISAQGSLPSGSLVITVEGNVITMNDADRDVYASGDGDIELYADSGDAGIGDVRASGNNVFIEATDQILDESVNGLATDVLAANLGLLAQNGIGNVTGAPERNQTNVLETNVSVLNARNTTGNDIEIDNSGPLTLSDSPLNVNGFGNEGVRNDGGSVVITTASPMTVSSDVDASTDAYLVAETDLTVDANIDARNGNVGLRSVYEDLFQDSGRIEADGGGVLIATDDDLILDRAGDFTTTSFVTADSTFTSSLNPPAVTFGIAVLAEGDVDVNTELTTTGGTNRHIIVQADAEFSNADSMGGAQLENTWPDPLNDDPSTAVLADGAGSSAGGAGDVVFNTGSSIRGAAINAAGGVSINAADDVRVAQNGMTIDADGVIDRSAESLHVERAVAVLAEEYIDFVASNGTPTTINTVDASTDGTNGVELVADYDFGALNATERERAGVNSQGSDGNTGDAEINGVINTSGLADWTGGDVVVTTTGGDVRVDEVLASGGADGADVGADGAAGGNITLVPDADTSTSSAGYEIPDGLVTLTGDLHADGGAPSGSGTAGSGGTITIGPATRLVNALGVASVVGRDTTGRLSITANGAPSTGRIEIGEDETFTSLGSTSVAGDGRLLFSAGDQIELGDIVVDGRLDVRGNRTADVVFHLRDADDLLQSNGRVVTDQGMDVVARDAIRFSAFDTITPMDLDNARDADPQFATPTPRRITPFLVNNYVTRELEQFPALTLGSTVLDTRVRGPLFGVGNKLRRTLASRSHLPGVPSAIRPDGLPEGVVAMHMPQLVEDATRAGETGLSGKLTNMYNEYFSNRSWMLQFTDPWNLFLESVGEPDEEDEQTDDDEE